MTRETELRIFSGGSVLTAKEQLKLYLLPVQGLDTQWYQNLLRNRWIRISTRSAEGEFEGTPITNPKVVSSVVEKFREKYGSRDVKKYYSKFDVAVAVDFTKSDSVADTSGARKKTKLASA